MPPDVRLPSPNPRPNYMVRAPLTPPHRAQTQPELLLGLDDRKHRDADAHDE